MFPSSIHENILKLDKQIFNLELKFENMDLEKKKKNVTLRQPLNKCSKSSNLRNNTPILGDTSKKSFSELKNKKITSPASSRLCSFNPLPLSKKSNSHREPLVKSGKEHEVNSNCSCCCHYNCLKLKQVKSVHCEDKQCKLKNKEVANVDGIEKNSFNNTECLLHKEVLFSEPGGRIEVTVRQKSNLDCQKENLEIKKKHFVDSENCNCQTTSKQVSGPKWSKILCSKSVREKNEANAYDLKTNKWEGSGDTNTDQPKSVGGSGTTFKKRNLWETDQIKSDGSLSSSKFHQGKRMSLDGKQPFDADTKLQELSQNIGSNSPLHIFQLLIDELKNKSSETRKKKLIDKMDEAVSKSVSQESSSASSLQNDIFLTIQKLCDNLIKEKENLSNEINSKNETIKVLRKKEEEYLSIINNLKSNLVKEKEGSQNRMSALNEFRGVKQKLLDQIRANDNMKKIQMQMKGIIEKYILENDRLQTEVRMCKLQAKKHDVLMAGKEAEIKKYRDEIANFQKQISEHLAALKTNAQVIDVKKMMEAIIQQSQVFTHDDLDSVVEADKKSSFKSTKLMHSSPTSTKTSGVDSSWKDISSIKGHQTVPNFDEKNEEEFFQIFKGDQSSESVISKHSLNKAVKNFLADHQKQEPESFTSCMTVHSFNSYESDGDLESENSEITDKNIKFDSNQLSAQKIKDSIDELLKNMKHKWVKDTSEQPPSDNDTIEDFLNGSFVSSIAE